MFTHILTRMRKQLDVKRAFRIHLITFNEHSLDECLANLPEAVVVRQVPGIANHHVTLEANMRYAQLRRAIEALPSDVAVAYEEI